jgi:hypothetical protein
MRRNATGSSHRVRLTAALLAITAGGTLLISACSPGSSNTAAPPQPSASSAAKPSKHHALNGVITAEKGETWTIKTSTGEMVTVNIQPLTRFGTKTAPTSPQSYPVGTKVRVSGHRTGATVNATAITAAKSASSDSTAPSNAAAG